MPIKDVIVQLFNVFCWSVHVHCIQNEQWDIIESVCNWKFCTVPTILETNSGFCAFKIGILISAKYDLYQEYAISTKGPLLWPLEKCS